MKTFLREYWVWMVIPFVLVIGGICALLFVLGGDGGTSPFVYNLQ